MAMERGNTMIYILLAVLITNVIRVLPVVLIKGRIKNQFLCSFLYYVPYVTLAVMTFPAIVEVSSSPLAGIVALIVGIFAAWYGMGLFPVASLCCVIVYAVEKFFV